MLDNLASQEIPVFSQGKLVSTVAGMDIHDRIKEKRIERGLSMERLAELCGYKSWQTVQQWEKPEGEGGTSPRKKALLLAAKALSVTPEWLQFGGADAATDGLHVNLDFSDEIGSTEQIRRVLDCLSKMNKTGLDRVELLAQDMVKLYPNSRGQEAATDSHPDKRLPKQA